MFEKCPFCLKSAMMMIGELWSQNATTTKRMLQSHVMANNAMENSFSIEASTQVTLDVTTTLKEMSRQVL